jgi:hypothetical protein
MASNPQQPQPPQQNSFQVTAGLLAPYILQALVIAFLGLLAFTSPPAQPAIISAFLVAIGGNALAGAAGVTIHSVTNAQVQKSQLENRVPQTPPGQP